MKNYQTLNYYLEQFRQNVLKSHEVDYTVQGTIRRANRAVDNYRLAAKRIAEFYPESIASFAEFLYSDNLNLCNCCAVCIMEMFEQPNAFNNEALNIIRSLAKQEYAWELWLKYNGYSE